MPTLKGTVFTSAFIFVLLSTAIAQESTTAQNSSLAITAAAAGERVRITAPAAVVQMRVEVYAAGGEKLFDRDIRGGNVFDWRLQDQGQRVAPGSYVFVVTTKTVSGKINQKIGSVSIGEKSVSVQSVAAQQLSPAQSRAIGPVEEDSSWVIVGTDEPQTPTIVAHDGTDGQMIRGRGALTFRIGNFFTGLDQEQMRLTEDGNLGIGTSEPKTTLDVAGTIRAQRYLISKPKAVGPGVSAQDSLTANVIEPDEALLTGSGTQDRIAKWLDNSGTLGDSGITETGGNVGIGTTTPGSKLVVSANGATLPAASGIARFADADGVQTAIFADAFGTSPLLNVRRANGTAAAPSAVQANQLLGAIGASGYGASGYMGTRARVGFFASENWTNTANGSFITFNTTAIGAAVAGGTERMRIDSAGNVGIGTANPTRPLEIANGKLRFSSNLGDIEFTETSDMIGWATTASPDPLLPALRVDVGTGLARAFTVLNNGKVGIGASATAPDSMLQIKGDGSTFLLKVVTSGGVDGLKVVNNGVVSFGALYSLSSTNHLCYHAPANLALTTCSSATEYVPTVNNGSGFPETADLVSIAPARTNPYGDTHAPFVVQKSATACDDQLLGYIVKPESGADGPKKNEHYLPLAIYGYFPAKVTTENGAIKRGDPITSSSRPGFGMKATGACKIIGYALDDANRDGEIQVFANTREHTAPPVKALQARVEELRRDTGAEVEELRRENAAIKARLEMLERAATASVASRQQ